MNRSEFVDEMQFYFEQIQFRRDLNLFYKGVPARVVMALLNTTGVPRPWMSLDNQDKAAILSTPTRPALIPVEAELDDTYRWSYKAPKSGSVSGNQATYANWKNIIEQAEKTPLSRSEKAPKSSKSMKAIKPKPAPQVPKEFRDRDMLIASLRGGGFLIQPDFLVNFLDYGPEELKSSLSDWVDETYPKSLKIPEKRGAFKASDIKAHLKCLAVMRLMNKFTVNVIQNRGLRRFLDDTSDRDFYTDRKKAIKVYLKYFTFDAEQHPRHFDKK
jgi:hypothetical protein